MQQDEEQVVRDADQDAVLGRAIEQIVRRELQLSEERQKVRLDAHIDDIRSELRVQRRMDAALDTRQAATDTRVDQLQALNTAAIRESVKAAVAEIFSPLRVLAALSLLLVVLVAVLTLVQQLQSWAGM